MEHGWLQITAGQGPDECSLAVKHVMNFMMKEMKTHGLKAEILEAIPGNKSDGYVSALISIKGSNLRNVVDSWQGTIQWICESPYRPQHKRKNWFIGVNALTPPQKHALLKEREVKFETMRASGPGGQHVNTTDSAVRATHLPTGLTTIAREERSQHMNKKLATARLLLLLEEQNQFQKAVKVKEKWENNHSLERGNPIRIFIGTTFKER